MRERTPFAASTLARLPALRLLVTTGRSNAVVDASAAHALGITVCGTASSSTSVPELTIGMALELSRHITAENNAMHSGGWQHTVGRGLAGRTLGVVGLGRLGTLVAKLASAFNMRVLAWSPHLTRERALGHGVQAVSKEELFSLSDIVTLHMPLIEGTRGLIGATEFAWMRSSAYFINTSRGPIVDERALIDAIRSKRIAGAGLDVFDIEPLPREHILRSLPNVLLLPHIGYVTDDTFEVFYADVVEDILAYGDGHPVRVI